MISEDEIKRTTGPQTTDGRRWEVQLSATPCGPWLDIFKECSAKALPHRVEFDRAAVTFKSDETQVAQWVASIDTAARADSLASVNRASVYTATAITRSRTATSRNVPVVTRLRAMATSQPAAT